MEVHQVEAKVEARNRESLILSTLYSSSFQKPSKSLHQATYDTSSKIPSSTSLPSPTASIPFPPRKFPVRTALHFHAPRPKLTLVTPVSLARDFAARKHDRNMGSAPRLGALGHTFTAMRAMQFVSLVSIIGMVSNFISEINGADAVPPSVLIGTLVISCIATLYISITYILYYDNMLPLLLAAGADTFLLIAVIVVACLLGKPLSYLDCAALPKSSGSTANFMASVTANINTGSALNYFIWVGADQGTCYAIKAVWGLSIALVAVGGVGGGNGGGGYAPSFPPPPTREVRGCYFSNSKKSLGTAAVLAREKRFDSDYSSGSDSDDVHHVAAQPPASQHIRTTAWFPPPPMPVSTQRQMQMPPTTAQVQHKRVQIVEQRQPVHPMPVLPELIVSPAPPLSPAPSSARSPMTPVEHLVHGKGLGRGKSKRKTIMEFIDGWWDLGLLEQQKRAASRRKA
ncbi:hypothetical protein CABS01_08113 [Colletotrichum abscissum]|uniref:uncharacterized protein n=1 Tax=Colletotrichum abscissum TaxID=1671311 RepID=UPI0027D6E616|nr:uncharacterized protein CABS01_08113 [Colletotrichum abscissum]KAK1508883.1 hypothetical protein CABS01_08113 [Colletotrichum abscissum]